MDITLTVPPSVTVQATGTQGAPGNGVFHGTGVPDTGLGNDGDFYIDNTAPTALVIYGPKASGAWGAGVPLGGGGSGVTPSSTVVSGTSFGAFPAVGAATTYSRGDHTHGTPAMPRLDQVGAPVAAVALNAQKITSLANGAAATDAAAFGQIPTAGTTGSTYAAGNDSRITGATQKTANLSDLASPSTARTSLGLGGAAVLNVGTTTGTVAAGDDTRLSNARTPTAHAATHATGGTDPISASSIGAADLNNAFVPADFGLIGWAFDFSLANQNFSLTSGQVRLIQIKLRAAITITNLCVGGTTAASAATVGQNFVGLYGPTGTLLAQSADATTAFGTTGGKTIPLAAPYSATAGVYYVAILYVGTGTAMSCWAGSNQSPSPVNFGLTLSAPRYLAGPSAQTSLPSSITFGSQAFGANSIWAAVN